MSSRELSRREFLARSGVGAAALASGALGTSVFASPAVALPARRSAAQHPIGIELYAVRTELAKDLSNTLKTVKQIGYEAVEFYAPYLAWTVPQAKDVRKQLDDLGLKCFSTHNTFAALTPGETMTKAIALNQAIGARTIILASPPTATTADDWKRVAGQLATASDGHPRREHAARVRPPTRRGHVSRSGRRSGRVDQVSSRPHQECPPQGL